jgi:NADPH2:quinone reductase
VLRSVARVQPGERLVVLGAGGGVGLAAVQLGAVLGASVCRILGFQFRDFAAHAPEELARNETALLELLAAGRALPHVGTTFPLAEAAAALRQVADGKAIGKVVLVIGLGETGRSVRENQNQWAERTRGDWRTAATDRSAGPS